MMKRTMGVVAKSMLKKLRTTGQDDVDEMPMMGRLTLSFVELSLVAVAAWQLSNLFLTNLESNQPLVETLDQLPAADISNKDEGQPQTTGFLAYDPFYQQTVAATNVDIAAPTSSLNVQIFGARYNPTGNSSVILKVQGQDQMRAVEGDELSPNVRLLKIYADRIEIMRHGARESVTFETKMINGNKAVPMASTSNSMQNAPASAGGQDQQAYRAALQELIDQLDLSPLSEGRGIKGFVIGRGANDMALNLLKLVKNDVILAVNDQPLNTKERLKELVGELDGARQLVIKLNRLGEDKEVPVSLVGKGF